MNATEIVERLHERLSEMGRKTYLYKSFPQQIIHWEIIGSRIKIETSRQLIYEEMDKALSLLENDFLETEEEPGENLPTSANGTDLTQFLSMPTLKSLKTCEDMGAMLLTAMAEVQKNPAFKDQAQVMANMMGKGIDWAKTEIDAFRVAQTIVRNR